MWIILTRKCFAATKLRQQSGQGFLEYILILVVVVGIFLAIARPGMNKLGKNITDSFNEGIFSTKGDGGGFYYYPVK